MKKFILVALFVILVLPVSAQTLNCGVEYTVNSVRQIAFDGIDYKLDKSTYIFPNEFDGNSSENKNALKNGYTLQDRELQEFSAKGIKAYAVTYKNNPHYTFIYLALTHSIIFVDIVGDDANFPFKSVRYGNNGDLYSVWVNVSEHESFGYDKNKNLISHCKDNYCYGNSGKIIGTRKVVESYD